MAPPGRRATGMRASMPSCRGIMLCALIFMGGVIASSGRKGRPFSSSKAVRLSGLVESVMGNKGIGGGNVMDDDDTYEPDLMPRIARLRAFEAKLKRDLGKKYKSVQNCTESLLQAMIALENINANASTVVDGPVDLFDSWAMYLGDLGDFQECAVGGNLYCAVETNFSQEMLWSGVCFPPPCSPAQVQHVSDTINDMKMSMNGQHLSIHHTNCYPSRTEWSWGTIATLVVFGVLILLASISTAYDLMKNDDPKHIKLFRKQHSERELLLTTAINGADSPLAPPCTQNCGCEEDRDHFKRSPSLYHIFRCFSFKRSWQLLTSLRKNCARPLRFFDGIRVLSIMWILVGQVLMIQSTMYDNVLYLENLAQRPSFQIILHARLGTDTFFFMGGFFATYRLLHVFAFRGHAPTRFGALRLSLKLILRRYLRLTPLLALVMLFYLACLPDVFDGPIWSHWQRHSHYQDCSSEWWTILVYGQNYVGGNCMSWTWYTATDMQLFAMSPFITLLFWHYGVAALALVTLLTIGCVVVNTIVVHNQHIQTCEESLEDLARPLDQYDTEPWIRAIPYLFGITLAFFYNAMGEFSNGSQVVSRPLTRFVTYLIMAALLSLPIFATVTLPEHEGTAAGDCKWSSASNAAYLSLYRLSWSLGMFILAGTCMIGWNSPISKLLSARAWSPFSRLVYGVYLVHPILIEIRAFAGNKYLDFSVLEYSLDVAGFALLSFVTSAIMFLLVEGPLYQVRQLM